MSILTCAPIFGWCFLFFMLVESQQDLLNGCKLFDLLAYIKPYNVSQEAMLVDHYFSDFEKNISIVYAQRGSCQEYTKCVRASSSAFSTCSVFQTISECTGNTGWPAFVFENCKGDRCELTMSPNATKCHYEQWRKIPAAIAKPCTHDLDDNMLYYRPMGNLNALNGSHCLLPLPKGSKIFKQIECKGKKKDEPYYKWTYEFSHSLSEGNYSCLLRSRCERMEHPLDFICISGKNSANILRRAASTRMAIDILAEAKNKTETTENVTKKIETRVALKPENSAKWENHHCIVTFIGSFSLTLLAVFFA
ncbi:hypothetical protein BSKO_09306 [Bryopsis sp. KO-2023]|nr:hypothetical protein BSKO_09306 [Bryopsis sp. KO-2023]